MKLNQMIGFAALAFATASVAAPDNTNLAQAREQVAKQYIQDLQNADYQDITQLFDKNGFVVSNSRGKVDAKEFFYGFLPQIKSAKTELHQFYLNANDCNRVVARFFFSFDLKSGNNGHGEYVDEFVFANGSAKLAAVYMFENLNFNIVE